MKTVQKSTRKTTRLLTVMRLAVCLFLFACGSSTALPAAITPSPTLPAAPTPPANATGAPTQPTGSPAITPTGTGPAPLTTSDIQAFFQQYPTMPFARTSGTVTVSQITFESSRAVQAALHGSKTGFPDTAPLCLVLLNGQFDFPAPPGASAGYQQGFAVFDATNGNFLMSGGLLPPSIAGTSSNGSLFAHAPQALPLVAARTAPQHASSSLVDVQRTAGAARPRTTSARSTYTCPNSQHCYGVVSWTSAALQSNQLAGLGVDISYTTLTAGDGFVDNEAWLVQTGNQQCGDVLASITGYCWIELGTVSSEVLLGGEAVQPGTQYFWAELAPDSGFVFHDIGAVPAADQNSHTPDGFFISWDGTNTWQVGIVGLEPGSELFFAYSGNSFTPNLIDMGQELFGTTGASSAGTAVYSAPTFYDGYVLHVGGNYIHVAPGHAPISSNPPFFTWLIPPSPSVPVVEFDTHCC